MVKKITVDYLKKAKANAVAAGGSAPSKTSAKSSGAGKTGSAPARPRATPPSPNLRAKKAYFSFSMGRFIHSIWGRIAAAALAFWAVFPFLNKDKNEVQPEQNTARYESWGSYDTEERTQYEFLEYGGRREQLPAPRRPVQPVVRMPRRVPVPPPQYVPAPEESRSLDETLIDVFQRGENVFNAAGGAAYSLADARSGVEEFETAHTRAKTTRSKMRSDATMAEQRARRLTLQNDRYERETAQRAQRFQDSRTEAAARRVAAAKKEARQQQEAAERRAAQAKKEAQRAADKRAKEIAQYNKKHTPPPVRRPPPPRRTH